VGARDQVPAAIDRLGPPGVIVHGLKVKPGKPTVLAAVDGRPVIGLPGNPASALDDLQRDCGSAAARADRRDGGASGAVATFGRPAVCGTRGLDVYVPAEFVAGGVRPLALPVGAYQFAGAGKTVTWSSVPKRAGSKPARRWCSYVTEEWW